MIKAIILGYGNIGKHLEQAVIHANDFELCGIIRRKTKENKTFFGTKIVNNIDEIKEKIDVCFLCVPTRNVEEEAIKYLNMAINTVDSFDIHEKILDLKNKLDIVAKKNNKISIISAGWDPGVDSIIRCIFDFLAPNGITYTNFGPGMSMGHSTAVKNMKGVKDALSITVPKGYGIHKRMVYIVLEDNYDFKIISKKIKEDDYFKNDETYIFQVKSIEDIKDMGHGVNISRKGVSSNIDNQILNFDMKINNPAVTAQIMLSSSRCIFNKESGAYTLVELPVIDFMHQEKNEVIKNFV